MVEPLISEAAWAEILQDTPAWEVPGDPMLVIAPHPDDETLGVGGLIAGMRQRGVDITVAAVTDGEHAYPENSAKQVQELRYERTQEQTQALQFLGVSSDKIVRFKLPDSNVQSCLGELIDLLLPLVARKTHLIAPWLGDFHPDHHACGSAAETVALRTGARLTSYFFWTWHQGSTTQMSELSLRSFALTPALMQRKTSALYCHRSQLHHHSGDPILPENLLAPVRRSFETFLVSE